MPTAPPAPPSFDPQPSAPPVPELTLLSDVVPRLRPDLSIAPRQGEAGLFDVAIDDGSGRAFTLYDFEVSIARMLDGRRVVSQLIEAASRIGIPVTLESLRQFIRQLRAYGFLEVIPVVASGESGWAPRTEWRPEVRELFQSALRTFRNDRLTEARGYLEALLQIEPEVPEAIALLARIEERILSGEDRPPPSFDALHGEEAEAPDAPPRVSEDAFEDSLIAPRPRRRWPWLVAGVTVLGLAGVSALPMPARISASAQLSPAGAPVALVAPRSGTIAEELAKPGAWVKAGQPLIRLEDGDLVKQEQAAKDALAQLAAQAARLERRAQGHAVLRAKATWEKKRAALVKTKALRDALAQRQDARSRRRLRGVERTLSKKEREVTRLEESYQRRAGTALLQSLATQRQAKEAEVKALEASRASSVLTAGQDGAFQPARREGDPVLNGETVGTLVDARKLKVTLGIPARQAMQVKEGQPVSIRIDGSATPLGTVILTTSGESAGPGLVRATATLDNADRKIPVSASGLAEIDCGSRPLYRRFLAGR